MTYPKLNFFNAALQCMKRTKVQREFEQRLYLEGLEKKQVLMIESINKLISSEDLATKFVLQELDVARNGDAFSQNFAKQSGFHPAQYLGALKKFEQDEEALAEVQTMFLNFLNQINNETLLSQTAMTILDGIMEHWVIGKYSPEGKLFLEDTETVEIVEAKKDFDLKNVKSVIMEKLQYADDRIQDVLDSFDKSKTKPAIEEPLPPTPVHSEVYEEVVEEPTLASNPKTYTDEEVNVLMETYSHVIEDIITGQIDPDNIEAILHFQEEISKAAQEGNNLASVFCAFFTPKPSFSTLPLPIINMNDKSKTFFIQILSTFEAKGFSKSLKHYFEENRENVYALATSNDKFMQYLMAFWYAKEHEEKSKVEEQQKLWYSQSATNGFEPALQKLQALEATN